MGNEKSGRKKEPQNVDVAPLGIQIAGDLKRKLNAKIKSSGTNLRWEVEQALRQYLK